MKTALILLFGGLILIVVLTRLSRNSEWRLKRMLSLLEKSKKYQGKLLQDEKKKLQKQIYKMIDEEIVKENPEFLYQALDGLKLYFGEGMGQKDDPARIGRIISQAMQNNKTDVLSYAMHAFCPFIRKSPVEYIPAALEQLGIIAMIAVKRHKNFVASRAVEIIFEGMERFEKNFFKTHARKQGETNIQTDFVVAGARAIKAAGFAALRGGDLDLFRELCVKTSDYIRAANRKSAFADMWAVVFAAWLNQLGRKENKEALTILLAHIEALIDADYANSDREYFDEKSIEVLIIECRHIIGVSSLNPYNSFAAPMLSFLLSSAFKMRNIQLWRQAAACAQESSQIAVSHHGIAEAFPTVYPLLESGRKLMLKIIRGGQYTEEKVFFQEAFTVVVKECVKIAEYESRKNFVLTAADIIIQIRGYWLNYPEAKSSSKYLNKFCQFLIFYWMKNKSKLAGQIVYPPQEINERHLLKEEEIRKMEFLF